MGHHISLPERALVPRGWAMECRITAEDPFQDFLPAAGAIETVRLPEGPGVRWDGWIEPGTEVPRHYDSLLGKLVVWGESRERAIKRMVRALDDLVITGLPTSREFHRRVMDESAFQKGDLDIEYWERVGRPLMSRAPDPDLVFKVAAAAALLERDRRSRHSHPADRPGSPGPTGWLEAARREGLR
jgi:acetyl-CoA carboxylase biotin carboxylase subunit